MNKKILIAGLFATLMLTVPMTSVVGISDVENDCGCQVVNNPYLVKLKMQFSRLEVYTKLLLMLYKHNPEITDTCEEILDIINSDSFWYFPIFCSIFEKLFNATYILYNGVGDLGDYLVEKFPNLESLICLILVPIFESLGLTLGYMYMIGVAFCDWDPPWPNSAFHH